MAEYTVVKVSDVPDQSADLGHDPAIFVKVGAPNTGPGDTRGVPDDFAWPD